MKWRIDDIKLVIHPDQQVCVRQRFHNSGVPMPGTAEDINPTELPFALVWYGFTFTHIYLSATQEITRGWYDDGQDTDHLFWVYLANPALREVYGKHTAGDGQRLFDFFKMFGDTGALSVILIDNEGRHCVLKWHHLNGKHEADLFPVTETTVIGDFGVMTAEEFRTILTVQVATKMNESLNAALTIPTDEG